MKENIISKLKLMQEGYSRTNSKTKSRKLKCDTNDMFPPKETTSVVTIKEQRIVAEIEKVEDDEREDESEGQLEVCKEKRKRYGNAGSNNEM
ncbi:2936_t:CDS:2 [Acaulospora morrowiae]|uniref:2936_t:CDS:1 n=1 Tax=Acaulospora morrowiae TaxID=94023 RepID=A0A9N9G7R1_9GLOM|nr:2936_t:CDS:2 [Acaulospora morrowiae]